jgi:hypothetical protein
MRTSLISISALSQKEARKLVRLSRSDPIDTFSCVVGAQQSEGADLGDREEVCEGVSLPVTFPLERPLRTSLLATHLTRVKGLVQELKACMRQRLHRMPVINMKHVG